MRSESEHPASSERKKKSARALNVPRVDQTKNSLSSDRCPDQPSRPHLEPSQIARLRLAPGIVLREHCEPSKPTVLIIAQDRQQL